MKSLAVSICIGSLVGVGLCLSGCEDTPTDSDGVIPGTDWRLVESGLPYTIRSMAANDTLLIGVGDYSTIYCTSDGKTWMPSVADGLNEHLAGAAWSGTQFVVVGSFGTVVTSPDAVQWTRQNTGSSIHLQAVACSDTLIVAVGNIGVVLTSTDGINWTLQPQIGVTTLYDVLYDGDLWITCGTNGKIYASTDAINWIEQKGDIQSTVAFTALTRFEDEFFAVGIDWGEEPDLSLIYWSWDGREWLPRTTIEAASRLRDIYWSDEGLLVAGYKQRDDLSKSGGLLLTSTNGRQWTDADCEAPTGLEAIGEINGTIVATGYGGYILTGSSIYNLEIVESGALMADVVWAGGRYVAVTEWGTSMTSRNGEEWKEFYTRTESGLKLVAYSSRSFVAVGKSDYYPDDYSAALYFSRDARDWTLTWEEPGEYLTELIWAGGQFVAIGLNGSVLQSYNGRDWTRQSVGDTVWLSSVCWDGNKYMVTSGRTVYFSRTGDKWERYEFTMPDNAILDHVAFGRNRYVGHGSMWAGPLDIGHSIYTSIDGLDWTKQEVDVQDYIYDLAWTGSMFVVCGENGLLMTSRDGYDWTTITTETSRNLNAIGVSPRKILVVGDNRTVLASP